MVMVPFAVKHTHTYARIITFHFQRLERHTICECACVCGCHFITLFHNIYMEYTRQRNRKTREKDDYGWHPENMLMCESDTSAIPFRSVLFGIFEWVCVCFQNFDPGECRAANNNNNEIND